MLTMMGRELENTQDWDKRKTNVRAGRHLVEFYHYTPWELDYTRSKNLQQIG